MLKDSSRAFAEPHDPTPVAKPTRLRVPTQSERVMAYVRLEHMRAQERGQFETPEEADDFELDDGEEWFSPYEETFEPEVDPLSPPPPAPPTPAASSPPSPAGENPPPTAS